MRQVNPAQARKGSELKARVSEAGQQIRIQRWLAWLYLRSIRRWFSHLPRLHLKADVSTHLSGEIFDLPCLLCACAAQVTDG